MFETELKFQIPPERLPGVRQALATVAAGGLRLRARYFDTPDRRLGYAAMALRLRLEGDRWVQTLKGRGDGMLQRLDHEVVLDGADPARAPLLDLSRHDGNAAGEALRRALGDAADRLACRFETDVSRTLGHVEQGGATIELALDLGEIRAGAAVWPLHELEFELKAGPVAGLLAEARTWVAQHGLWLDVRSKAERGERLASGLVVGPAHALPATGDGRAPMPALAKTLAAVLANLSDRVDPRCASADRRDHARWAQAGLVQLCERGTEPDLVARTEALVRRLQAFGPDAAADPADWLRDAPVQALWLDWIGAATGH
ncbi:CYTH domain-containing protein [Sphaerotilus mobilis]|uniref:CYTH domain-containing protein n=1 Tax=Sphaerotilus mobilis TaxID=47994 RepID=A0A4Q7LK50_9BURK|nr:CYTH domain-containing protein [Sphaerotilus mobilis]RZS55016.1 CYTH domain-containing protein [Sphaerotilus mobilis]